MEKCCKLAKYWFNIDDKIRFLLIGCFNAGVSYLLFVIFIAILGIQHKNLCVSLQWGISSIFSYFNQKIFVFCTKGNYIKEYLKCCGTWFISYCLNIVVLDLLLRYHKNILVAQFISLFIVSIVTYIIFKYFAFKKQ